jgi:hypothetical protein
MDVSIITAAREDQTRTGVLIPMRLSAPRMSSQNVSKQTPPTNPDVTVCEFAQATVLHILPKNSLWSWHMSSESPIATCLYAGRQPMQHVESCGAQGTSRSHPQPGRPSLLLVARSYREEFRYSTVSVRVVNLLDTRSTINRKPATTGTSLEEAQGLSRPFFNLDKPKVRVDGAKVNQAAAILRIINYLVRFATEMDSDIMETKMVTD